MIFNKKVDLEAAFDVIYHVVYLVGLFGYVVAELYLVF